MPMWSKVCLFGIIEHEPCYFFEKACIYAAAHVFLPQAVKRMTDSGLQTAELEKEWN